MKKVLFFTNYFPKLPSFENFGTWAFDQAKAISKKNEVMVISFVPYFPFFLKLLNQKFKKWGNVGKEIIINKNLKIRYVRINPFLFRKFKNLKRNPDLYCGYFVKKLKKHINKFSPDIMIANHVMYEGYIANRISRKVNIPYICFEHSPDDFIPVNARHAAAYKKVVEQSALFVNVSEYSFDRINKIYNFNTSNLTVLYNYSQDAKIYRNDGVLARHDIKMNKKHIIEVANFENRKNHLTVLKAFVNLMDKFPDWDVVFVGTHDQTLERLNSFINEKNIGGRVQILRDVRHEDVLNILNFMDIFVLPSESEMFSVSVLEALSAGLSVISTVHNGLVDGIFKNSFVINIDPENLTDLEKYLTLLMSDDIFRRKTGDKNRLMYEKYFTGEIYEAKINDIIDRLSAKERL